MILRTKECFVHALCLGFLVSYVAEASQLLRASKASQLRLDKHAFSLAAEAEASLSDSPSGSFFSGEERAIGEWLIRPNQGGDADLIEFGVMIRDIYEVEMKVGQYTADVVLTWRWTDPRTIILTEGHKNLTLSTAFAREKIWMPDVGITNHAAAGIDVVSSSVIVERTGVVTKVERDFAILTNRFSATSFPFDTQELLVTVGSKTFMEDAILLKPMSGPAWTGVKGSVFDTTDFVLDHYELEEFTEIDGMLRKNRGQLKVSVNRDPSSYIGGSLVPELLVIAIAYTVFWFPLTAPFAMPRVATALIAFLSLMTLALKTNAILPRSAGLTWIDLFETSAQSVMFFTVCLNILALAGTHTFECKQLSERINNELKIWYPVLVIIVFGICAYSTRPGTSLKWMTMAVQMILILFAICYIGACLVRLYREVVRMNKEKKEKEEKEKAEQAAKDKEVQHAATAR